MAAGAPTRQEVQVCIGRAGLTAGSLVHVRQGRREYCAYAYDAAWLADPAHFNVSAELDDFVPAFEHEQMDAAAAVLRR